MSLKLSFAHVPDLMIAWTRVHAIFAVLIASDVRWAATRPAQVRKYGKITWLNRGAQRWVNCVTSSLSYQGPTIPVGPPYANPSHATWCPSGASAWPPAMRQRHLRLARASRGSATWPQCHVASTRWSRVPRQLVAWARSPRHQLR